MKNIEIADIMSCLVGQLPYIVTGPLVKKSCKLMTCYGDAVCRLVFADKHRFVGIVPLLKDDPSKHVDVIQEWFRKNGVIAVIDLS